MSYIITRPTNLSVEDWANNVTTDLRNFGFFGSLLNPDGWQQWGLQLLNNAALSNVLPDPYAFKDWREWADRVCDALA